MPKSIRSAEEKLRTLGQRLRQGWAKLHPVTDKEMRAVDEALEKQWAQTHPADATKARAETTLPPAASLSQSQAEQKPDQSPAAESESQDHEQSQ